MVQSMSAPSVPGDASVLNQNWAAFFFWVAFVMSCALILINLYTGGVKNNLGVLGNYNRGNNRSSTGPALGTVVANCSF
jgi:hypothetical protein